MTLQNGKQGSNLGVLEDDLKPGISGIFGTSRNPGSVLQKGKQGGNSICKNDVIRIRPGWYFKIYLRSIRSTIDL